VFAGELPPDVKKMFRREPRFTNVQPFTPENVVPLATRLTGVTQSVFQVIEVSAAAILFASFFAAV